jgi:hypothetical protein
VIESAEDARRIAALAAATLRLVNETAAERLIAAADRGETQARIAIDPVAIPVGAAPVGRLYDDRLIDAFDAAGAAWLARACRIFEALGFAVATVPEVEQEADVDRVNDIVRSIRVSHLDLGYATAQENPDARSASLLQAVALPAAHLWRARAEAARRVAQYEGRALSAIAVQAERGADSCRLLWREFGAGEVNREHLHRLAEALRRRGFRVDAVDSSAALHVNW